MWSNPQFPMVLVHSGVSRSELHGAEAVLPNPKIYLKIILPINQMPPMGRLPPPIKKWLLEKKI